MAEIAPFRGLRYNPEKITNLGEVFIPPYDVITPKEQRAFHELSPFNMIRLELGETLPEDSENNNPHTRAAGYFKRWQEEGILVRDQEPAIYYYELDYSLGVHGQQTRYGFMCALKLEDFDSGMVRPHEKTFKTIKDERLGLMLTCNANLSSVFALFDDPGDQVDKSLRAGRETDPIVHFKDSQGMEHRVWRVQNEEILRHVRGLVQKKDIFIADGHHRYETALNYRLIQRNSYRSASPRASFEYIMVYLSNLNQGGLTILPTHRMLRNIASLDIVSFLDKAEQFFHIMLIPGSNDGEREWCAQLDKGKSQRQTVVGFYAHGTDKFYILTVRSDAVSSYLQKCNVPSILHGLDVEILDQVILRYLLALPETFLANENNIHFKHSLSEGVHDIQSGVYQVGFFINPTRIEQVQEVARAGLIMPHKATYFYPKVGSGIVIRLIEPEEQMLW